MSSVRTAAIPARALLRRYVDSGAYADCYVVEVAAGVAQGEYVAAFYTTPLFKVERWLLRWLVARPSTDAEARLLSEGARDTFAAWRVEDRTADQLLLGDFTGRTKSWLMVEPLPDGGRRTRLYFGSAVIPRVDPETSRRSMGAGFAALSGFHRVYSRLLLGAAGKRLLRQDGRMPMTRTLGVAPYHAHIYYAAHERPKAASLREKLLTALPGDPLSRLLFVGELRDHKAGPHITSQFEIHFEERLLPAVEAELNHSGLSALIHPLTLDDLGDHTYLGRWIGQPVELDLTVLDPPGVNQGIARFGKSDF
jgi:aromatic ring-cleaving dioxygenase